MEHKMKMDGGSGHSRPMWHEVVRYAPWNYNEDRSYKYWETEWSEYGDVNGYYEATSVTPREYLYWERAYVSTFIAIAEKAGISSLILKGYRDDGIKDELKNGLPLPHKGIKNLRSYLKSLKEGKRIRRDGFELIATLILRGTIECFFASEDDSFIMYTGYDYYMYIRTSLTQSTLKTIAERYNMFVNPRGEPIAYWITEVTGEDSYYELEIREGSETITIEDREEGQRLLDTLNHAYYPE